MRDEHAIVYLVWKFMAVLISLEARAGNKDGIEIEEVVGIKNWLLDVHALLYQQGENQSDKIDLLRHEVRKPKEGAS